MERRTGSLFFGHGFQLAGSATHLPLSREVELCNLNGRSRILGIFGESPVPVFANDRRGSILPIQKF